MNAHAAGAVLALAASAGCLRTLETPPAPAEVMPVVEDIGPVPEGHVRVVFDATDQEGRSARSKVIEIVGTSQVPTGDGYVTYEDTRPVCTTPCIAHLRPGDHTLRYLNSDGSASPGDVALEVKADPLLVRQTLGYQEGNGGVALTGWLCIGIGGVGATASAIFAGIDDENRSKTLPLLGASLGFVALGIVLAALDPTVVQPSATAVYQRPRD